MKRGRTNSKSGKGGEKVRANPDPVSEEHKNYLVSIKKEFLIRHFDFLTNQQRSDIIETLQDTGMLGDFTSLLKETQAEIDLAEHQKQEGAKAAASRAYVVTERKGDSLVVMFMSVGSGDCILVRTPAGRVIVVDCGSRATPKVAKKEEKYNFLLAIRNVLLSELFLNGGKELHALILTHPDIDHYVDVPYMFPADISMLHVFHPLSLDRFEKLRKDKTRPVKANGFIRAHSDRQTSITIRQGATSQHIEGKPLTGLDKEGKPVKAYDSDTKEQWVEILTEDNCSIKLLAAGVENIEDKTTVRARYRHGEKKEMKGLEEIVSKTKLMKHGVGDPDNSSSIITLIESYGHKILLCGDATYSTEVFLLDKHKARIRDVSLAQIEHHGSGTSHAGNEYIETINPRLAAVSSGGHAKDRNPRWRAIKKYLGIKSDGTNRDCRLQSDMDEHYVQIADEDGTWLSGDNDLWTKNHGKKGLYTTHSNGDLCFIVDKNRNLIMEFVDKSDSEGKKKIKFTAGGDGKVTRDPPRTA